MTLNGKKEKADYKLQIAEGWISFAGGFFFGGLSIWGLLGSSPRL